MDEKMIELFETMEARLSARMDKMSNEIADKIAGLQQSVDSRITSTERVIGDAIETIGNQIEVLVKEAKVIKRETDEMKEAVKQNAYDVQVIKRIK